MKRLAKASKEASELTVWKHTPAMVSSNRRNKQIQRINIMKPKTPRTPASPYRPDKFATTFETMKGADFWAWLHQDHIVLMMETACYLRRPSIEAISPTLQVAFPQMRRSVKLRQMIGHMVRQILEQLGYHLDRANVRIKHGGNLFTFGSAYKKAA